MVDTNARPTLTSEPLFLQALSIAKGIAKRAKIRELTPALMLAGLARALLDHGGDYSALASKQAEIQAAVSSAGLAIGDEIEPASEGKMPVSASLKAAIATSDESIETFVGALLSMVARSTRINSRAYAEILAYSSAAAVAKGVSAITPELFSASAYVAFSQGKFCDSQSLSALFIANRANFEALVKETGLDLQLKPAPNQPMSPLAEPLLNALGAEGADDERLLAALDVGLKIGQKVVSSVVVAYHEAGHAVVSAILRPSLPVTKITIVQDGNADGVTSYDAASPYWDGAPTRESLIANIATLLAGRAAQLIKFGPDQIDVGASSDIESATTEAWKGIALYGLDHEVGPINLEVLGKLQGASSGWIFDLAQKKIQETLQMAAKRAEEILRANWRQVETIVAELLDRKTITEAMFAEAFVEKGLSMKDGAKRARSRPVKRSAIFARSPGILQTNEGPVRYGAGDVVLRDENGNSWPVSRAYLDRFYEPTGATVFGVDGNYVKARQEVLALQLLEDRRLDLPSGRGMLRGKAGDWIVDYGGGELSIVSASQFPELYELLPATRSPPTDSDVSH